MRIGLIAECLRDISAGSALDTVIALHDKAGVETGAAAH
ncbi:putative O-linked N-acetylglucosamine transferase (SPINDLY family) [Sphingobium fontiphilum]|uniref:Putative O-linked N-acetylglucosamine transferase (SPINDLY family) n=1 Tax=Sphingobium fontiphilum TaxID=944425 RepID=A0A7W6DCH4_9SPHN|nr:putative O-linked N-acetylglucosamine transferase (SPINDLY family) [Sphingobium fontiphilum]